LELVPSEIEKLLIPIPPLRPALRRLDDAIRSQPIDDVLKAQDRVILSAIGLKASDQEKIHQAWQALRDRRHRINPEDSTGLDDLQRKGRRGSFSAIDSKSRIEQVRSRYEIS